MREPEVDRLYALHEAAHAVTAEVLHPGISLEVDLDYELGREIVEGLAYTENTEAVYVWGPGMTWESCLSVTFASEYGERLSPIRLPRTRSGDKELIRQICTDRITNLRASLRARKIIKQNRVNVERLAEVLLVRRRMTGDEIREVIA